MGRWRSLFHRGIRLRTVTDLRPTFRGADIGSTGATLGATPWRPSAPQRTARTQKPERPPHIHMCASQSNRKACLRSRQPRYAAYRNAHGKNARPNAHMRSINQQLGPVRVPYHQEGKGGTPLYVTNPNGDMEPNDTNGAKRVSQTCNSHCTKPFSPTEEFPQFPPVPPLPNKISF